MAIHLLMLMVSTVGIPLLGIGVLSMVEALGAPVTASQQFKRVGHDLSVLSIGIAGSMFGNVKLGAAFDPGYATIITAAVILVNVFLSATAMLVDSRSKTWHDRKKASLSVFLGVLTVAIPSGIILYIAS